MNDTERDESWVPDSGGPADQRMEDAVGSAGSMTETSYPDEPQNPADRASGIGSAMPAESSGLGETTGRGAEGRVEGAPETEG
ncbi:hypothetical protein ACFFMN_06775 [Planobispora siamensis]|uniref:Uncharacterized protein n=1 Tax=Planobispora siamensis TaxID=936338 RepID=A0A8J3WPE0_9ACTN|nr:hypothetical protein [Planobispora siamensis]GIH95567.1 hypothetical protein Psi01_61970 [Planobispora siamensis]